MVEEHHIVKDYGDLLKKPGRDLIIGYFLRSF
jgi:hypothetical protein